MNIQNVRFIQQSEENLSKRMSRKDVLDTVLSEDYITDEIKSSKSDFDKTCAYLNQLVIERNECVGILDYEFTICRRQPYIDLYRNEDFRDKLEDIKHTSTKILDFSINISYKENILIRLGLQLNNMLADEGYSIRLIYDVNDKKKMKLIDLRRNNSLYYFDKLD